MFFCDSSFLMTTFKVMFTNEVQPSLQSFIFHSFITSARLIVCKIQNGNLFITSDRTSLWHKITFFEIDLFQCFRKLIIMFGFLLKYLLDGFFEENNENVMITKRDLWHCFFLFYKTRLWVFILNLQTCKAQKARNNFYFSHDQEGNSHSDNT